MNKIELTEMHLVGLCLQTKTTNENGKSGFDCGNLWQQFEKENYAAQINDKQTEEILAVYHQYEGDHTQPFSYFIGCKVNADSITPAGLDRIVIPKGPYQKFVATGKMPACIANAWKEIWHSGIYRAYKTDFEVYDGRSKDWNNAVVDIFISVLP